MDPTRTCSGRLVTPLLLYLRDHRPAVAVERILADAELHPADILGERAGEVPVHRVGRLLAMAARELGAGGDFERACAYRLADAWGGWKLAFWAPSLRGVLHRAANAQRYLFPNTRCRLDALSEHVVRVHIDVRGPEPELFPILRRALWSRIPTLAGLPPFRIEVDARFGPSVFDVDVREPPVGLGPLLGAGGGFALALVLGTLFQPVLPLALTLVASGAMVGWGWTTRRRVDPPPAERARTLEKMRRLATSVLLHEAEQRQIGARGDAWAERLISDVRRRHGRIREGDDDLGMRAKRQIRSFTHDLRNPLAVVRSGTEVLSLQMPHGHSLRPVVARMSNAVGEVEARVSRALELLAEASEPSQPSFEDIDTEMLTRSIRRRLRALVTGRNLRVSVFRSREAPDMVHCDRLTLDRALDLLLIRVVDAALEGAIAVEVGGRLGYLSIGLTQTGSDRAHADSTGRVVAKPGGEDASSSLLADTVERLSGRIEVESTSARATVSMKVPVRPADAHRPAATAAARVVRLR